VFPQVKGIFLLQAMW